MNNKKKLKLNTKMKRKRKEQKQITTLQKEGGEEDKEETHGGIRRIMIGSPESTRGRIIIIVVIITIITRLRTILIRIISGRTI